MLLPFNAVIVESLAGISACFGHLTLDRSAKCFSTNHNQTGTKNYLIRLTSSTLNIDPFQQSRPKQASKPPLLTLLFVVQMAKTIQLHYLDMLPLPHASEDVLDELRDVQMNVGNPVRVAAYMGSPA